MNQLVIKYYNGFEKELCYSITPLREWRRYSQKLPTMQLTHQELHRLRLSDKNPLSKVSPLRMNNIEIKLYTKTN
jgi:alpha-L-fucosidase